MGMVSSLIGANDDFKAKQAALQTSDYGNAINAAAKNGLMPTPGVVDNSQANQARGNQNKLVAALQAAASGQGPSLAQQQVQQATNNNVAAGASQIGSVRGMNPAAQARLILQNTANQNQMAAGQSGIARTNEINTARGELGNVLAGQRGQDINQASTNTQLGLDTINANTSRLGVAGGLQNSQNANAITSQNGANAIDADVAKTNAQTNAGIAGGLMGGVSGHIMGMLKKAEGGVIPGHATVKGDSYANDKVPAILSPGEVVLPRSISKDGDKAKEFVEALRKKQGKAHEAGFGKVLAAHKAMHERISQLEKMCYGGQA